MYKPTSSASENETIGNRDSMWHVKKVSPPRKLGRKRSIGKLLNSVKSMNFVERVFTMLEETESKGFDHIVRWEPDGKSFKVYQTKAFEDHIQPCYLNQSKVRSFQRKLVSFGFTRIQGGPSRGAYQHPCFRKGQRSRCGEILPRDSLGPRNIAVSNVTIDSSSAGASRVLDYLVPSALVVKAAEDSKPLWSTKGGGGCSSSQKSSIADSLHSYRRRSLPYLGPSLSDDVFDVTLKSDHERVNKMYGHSCLFSDIKQERRGSFGDCDIGGLLVGAQGTYESIGHQVPSCEMTPARQTTLLPFEFILNHCLDAVPLSDDPFSPRPLATTSTAPALIRQAIEPKNDESTRLRKMEFRN